MVSIRFSHVPADADVRKPAILPAVVPSSILVRRIKADWEYLSALESLVLKCVVHGMALIRKKLGSEAKKRRSDEHR